MAALVQPGQPTLRLLLVGAEAAAAREILQRAISTGPLNQGGEPAWVIDTAESILEAVLVSGDRGAGSAGQGMGCDDGSVIVAGVSQELEHLESGVRSLRQVNPDARIVLLCEPPEEVICRQALGWGADDYFIVPLDKKSTDQITAGVAARRARGGAGAMPRIGPGAANGADGGSAAGVSRGRGSAGRGQVSGSGLGHGGFSEPPGMPLNVQTELLEELLAGGLVGGAADFVGQAVARLATHLGVDGRLRFEAEGRDRESDILTGRGQGDASDLRRPVVLGDQTPFGTLVLAAGEGAAGGAAGMLEQAAHWLAAMLAMAQRFKQLRALAITDELSGAYNLRYFNTYMANLLEKAKVSRSRVTLLLFDIDDFKKYNDMFGHASGDAIIRELIKLLRACTREYDLVARIGGDEFAVVYRDNEAKRQPNSEHPKDVLVATERFREAIRNHSWTQTCNIKGEVSISGGLATFPWDADSFESLRVKADEALLRAKAAGKNVIVMHKTAGGAPQAADAEE